MKFSIAVLTAVALSMGSVAAAPSYGNMNWNHYGVAPVPNGGYTNKAYQACDQYGHVKHEYPHGIYPYSNNQGLHNIHGQRCSWTGKLVYQVPTGGWQVNGYACNIFGNVIKGLPRYVWPNGHGKYYNNHHVECTRTGQVISHGSGYGNGNGNGYQNGGGSANQYGVIYKNGLSYDSEGYSCDQYGHRYKLNKGVHPNPNGYGWVNNNLKPCNPNGILYSQNYHPSPMPKPTYNPDLGYVNKQGDSTDSRGYQYYTSKNVYANQHGSGYINKSHKACDYQGNTTGYTTGGSANGPATTPSTNNYGGSSNGPATTPYDTTTGGSSNGPATTPYDTTTGGSSNGPATTPYTNNGGSSNGYPIIKTGNSYTINGQPCDQSGHIISKPYGTTKVNAKPAYPTNDDSSDNDSDESDSE